MPYEAQYRQLLAFTRALPKYLRMCKKEEDMEEIAIEIEDFLENLDDYPEHSEETNEDYEEW